MNPIVSDKPVSPHNHFDAGAEAVKNASAVMHGTPNARPTAPLSPVTTGFVTPADTLARGDKVTREPEETKPFLSAADQFIADAAVPFRAKLLAKLRSDCKVDMKREVEFFHDGTNSVTYWFHVRRNGRALACGQGPDLEAAMEDTLQNLQQKAKFSWRFADDAGYPPGPAASETTRDRYNRATPEEDFHEDPADRGPDGMLA